MFQTRVTPIADPRLRVQWYKDGQPLGNSNRFVLFNTNIFKYLKSTNYVGTIVVKIINSTLLLQIQAHLRLWLRRTGHCSHRPRGLGSIFRHRQQR